MPETIIRASRAEPDFPPGGKIKVSLTAGSVSSALYVRDSCVVTCSPGPGGTMLAEATWSNQTDVIAGTATWFDWDAGVVGAKANQLLTHATAVRFTATAASGVGEVAQ